MEQFGIPSVYEIYNNEKNYLIEYAKNKKSICAIYFSSNGIYFPNEEEIFKKEIIKKNKFEWYKLRIKNARKHIFLRDVFKQWYVQGINKDLKTIEDLFEFLKKETEGYEVITIGSSAGGYAAVLFGSLLNASRVLAFASQFNLNHILTNKDDRRKNPFIVKFFEISSNNKYLNIIDIIKRSNIHIFYFLPFYSREDKEQYNLLTSLENIYCFKIDCNVHGMPISRYSLQKTINFNLKKLIQIYEKIEGQVISPIKYEKYSNGFAASIYFCICGKFKGIFRLIFSRR